MPRSRGSRLEALPVEDASVDAVTSNCVINLVPDKPVYRSPLNRDVPAAPAEEFALSA